MYIFMECYYLEAIFSSMKMNVYYFQDNYKKHYNIWNRRASAGAEIYYQDIPDSWLKIHCCM